VKFHQAGDVQAKVVGAHHRALNPTLAQKVKAVQLDFGAQGDHAHNGGQTARTQHGK
jgi:hypothetical protein